MHLLVAVLDHAAAGTFPAADGAVDVLPPDVDGTIAVVAFTGHAYVLADVDPAELAARQSDDAGGGFGGALAPAVLQWLAGAHRSIGSIDVFLVAPGGVASAGVAPGGPGAIGSLAQRDDRRDHTRVRRAVSHRRDVGVYGDDDGLVVLGRGLVGRWELSVELFDPDASPAGSGRRLIRSGLDLVPDGERCWAQVASGNARSLRAFLACGFVPVGSEVLITTHP